MAAGPGVDGEVDEGGSTSPALWGAGFAEVVSIEPAILELVVARMARLTFGCRVASGDGDGDDDDDDGAGDTHDEGEEDGMW